MKNIDGISWNLDGPNLLKVKDFPGDYKFGMYWAIQGFEDSNEEPEIVKVFIVRDLVSYYKMMELMKKFNNYTDIICPIVMMEIDATS